MLKSILIENIVFIKSLKVEFDQSGLCVITGETGSGKSIILDCICFALGLKNGKDLLKEGCEEGVVQLSLSVNIDDTDDMENASLSGDVTLKRSVNNTGVTSCYINGKKTSLKNIIKTTSTFIEVYDQNNHRIFYNQTDIIDDYGSIDKIDLQKAYWIWKGKENEAVKFKNELADSIKQRSFFLNIKEELESFAPQFGEESELSEVRTAIIHKEQRLACYSEVLENLNNALSVLSRAQKILAKNNMDEHIVNMVDCCCNEVQELLSVANSSVGDLQEVDVNCIDAIEGRLFKLRDLSSKYGKLTDELPLYLDEILNKIGNIENQDYLLNILLNDLQQKKDIYYNLAQALSVKRKSIALLFEKALVSQLKDLKLPNIQIEISFKTLSEQDWNESGVDQVIIYISANPGVKMKPLLDIASGGELSRLMLALKVINCNKNSILILDEIDTGVGGAVADAVGKKLINISKNNQIIVVTHQPQIAAKADIHLHVSKYHHNNCTYLKVSNLSRKERENELAMMLAGQEISQESKAAAKKLLDFV